jgi:iron complex transport system ATP-binding protein
MSRPVIEICDLTFSIDGTKILDSLSLEVHGGEYLSIIGPNGAGKTTLLRCLMRIYHAPPGAIRVMGIPAERIGQRSLAKRISYVPQGEGRGSPFTVEEFVMLGRYPFWSPFTSIGTDDRRTVAEALGLTGIDHLADRRVDTLSGGERQTAYIAAAIAQGSDILLLDEPTTFLDPKHEAEIRTILRRLNRDLGRTIVSVTHDINAAVLESDRLAVLRDGKVIFTGTPDEVMSNAVLSPAYGKEFVFVDHPRAPCRVIVPDAGQS